MSVRWSQDDLNAVRRRLHGETQSPLRTKYGNVSMAVDGFKFDSKLEIRRYGELKTMQAAGLISELKVHQEFALHSPGPNGPERVCAYVADFSYMRDGKLVCEDAKNKITRTHSTYRLKRAMFQVEYGLTIVEILRTR